MYNNSTFSPNAIPKSAYEDGSYVNYKLGVYDPVAIRVLSQGKWQPLPQSAPGSSFIVSSLVNQGRNAEGKFVGSQIGRNQTKFNGLVFPALYAHEWKEILSFLRMDAPTFFKYYDFETGSEITRTLYPGDRTATIYSYAADYVFGETTRRPEILTGCSVNLIDRGD